MSDEAPPSIETTATNTTEGLEISPTSGNGSGVMITSGALGGLMMGGGVPLMIQQMAATEPIDRGGKVTQPWPNVANEIHDWLSKTWPELMNIAYAWFTGSSVWRFLYDMPLREGADLDVFIEPGHMPSHSWVPLEPGDAHQPGHLPNLKLVANNVGTWNPLAQIERVLTEKVGLIEPPKNGKPMTSLGGRIAYTKRGRVDYWEASHQNPMYTIQNYPYNSHGHCRAAYSTFHRMLLVCNNNGATRQGALELAERRMIESPDRVAALAREVGDKL